MGRFVIIVVIFLVIVIGLGKIDCKGPGPGPGTGSKTENGEKASDNVVISVESDLYLVKGKVTSLENVVSLADDLAKSGKEVIVKKKANARMVTIKKLEDELEKRGVRYRSENGF